MHKNLVFIAAAILALSAVQGEVVFGNLGSNGDGALGGSSYQIGIQGAQTRALAQGFRTPVTGGLLSLNSIVLGLSVTSGSSSARAQIFADNSGIPSGSALASASVNVTTPAQLYTFDLTTSPLLLESNSIYWLVVSDPDGGNFFNWVYNQDEVSPVGLNGSEYSRPGVATLTSTNNGLTWTDRTSNSERTASFYLNASEPPVIPEPGTWAAAALLIGLAGYVGWRRRVQAI